MKKEITFYTQDTDRDFDNVVDIDDPFPLDANRTTPDINIVIPTINQTFSWDTIEVPIEVTYNIAETFEGKWHYRVDSEFPVSGNANGTAIELGQVASITVESGEEYDISVVLVDKEDKLIPHVSSHNIHINIQAMKFELPEIISVTQTIHVISGNIILWADMSIEAGIATINTDQVVAIADGSGYNNHLRSNDIESTLLKGDGINSLQAIDFDINGNNSYMSIDGISEMTDEFTIYMVHKVQTLVSNGQKMWGFDEKYVLNPNSDGSVKYQQRNGTLSAGMSKSTVYVTGLIEDGSSAKFYVNSELKGTFSTGSAGSNLKETLFQIGKSFNGEFGEILIFNKALNEKEKNSVEYYLGQKWDVDGDSHNYDDGYPFDETQYKLDTDDDGVLDPFDAYPEDETKWASEIRIIQPIDGTTYEIWNTQPIRVEYETYVLFDGSWQYRLNSSFPESGEGGGINVSSGKESLINVNPATTYEIEVVLVDKKGHVLPSVTPNKVTISIDKDLDVDYIGDDFFDSDPTKAYDPTMSSELKAIKEQLLGWYDTSALNISGVVSRKGETPISIWADGSGNLNHLVQREATANVTEYKEDISNGLPGIEFSNDQQFTAMNPMEIEDAWTIVAVTKMPKVGTENKTLAYGSSDAIIMINSEGELGTKTESTGTFYSSSFETESLEDSLYILTAKGKLGNNTFLHK